MRLHRVFKGVGNIIHPLRKAALFVSLEIYVPVALDVKLTVLVDKIVRRHQLVNILEKCVARRRILKCQIILQRRLVQLLFKIGMLQKALYLRAEHECAAHCCIVHRLYPEIVPRPEKLTLFCVPYHKREHPAQLSEQLRAVLLVAVYKYLRVCVGRKRVPRPYKLCAYLTVVVYLAVEYKHKAFVLVENRLVTLRCYVNDAQTTVPKRYAIINVLSARIRSAMLYPVHHRPYYHF